MVDDEPRDATADLDRRAVEQRAGLPGPLRPRRPEDFDAMYTATPPWDIGRPQPAFEALIESGAVRGRVLDVGCGTGEHALMAAASGFGATGIDMAAAAIEQAQAKARNRRLTVRFVVHDALDLVSLGEEYDTVLDSGLFHVFEDPDRARFVEELRRVVVVGGSYQLLCFSDRQPGDWGPRRITQHEIRDSFVEGWRVDSIDAAYFDVNLEPGRALAWQAAITRI
jgi:SAM-dependent methyltransferase